ncbi:MAG: VWA domain-containing protein [Acidobacteria bacterium]|nr:VWA domain-containing protein [Acidobacteriota bacterium]MCA1627512.1 VWA domain-containing protein [Acidobacteriota bacterium]
MHYQNLTRPFLLLLVIAALMCGGVLLSGKSEASGSASGPIASASPSPTPRNREEVPQDSDEVVKFDTNLTNIFFTAADKNKRFVGNLKAEDIRVLEDGQPQEIFTFQTNIDLPLSLAILIDTSASEERTLPDLKIAGRAFLENILRNKDEAAILSFTGETTLEQGFTGNVERLRRAIDRVEFVPPSGYIGGGVVVNGTPPISGTNQILAGSTAIWDAVWATAEELISASAEHTRRAIILLTDGDDTSSRMKMHDAIERAQKADALIYAIGIGDRYTFNVDEGALRKIAEQTGGRAYFPKHERDLNDAFAQIQRDLREQYLVAYSPSNKARDGSFRKIEIHLVNPALRQQNLKLNYRTGYFAKTATGETPVRKRGQ